MDQTLRERGQLPGHLGLRESMAEAWNSFLLYLGSLRGMWYLLHHPRGLAAPQTQKDKAGWLCSEP